MDIYLKRAVLHMCDRNSNTMIYSDELMDLTQDFSAEYAKRKVEKISNSQTKLGTLKQEGKLGQLLTDTTRENFLEKTREFTEMWAHYYLQSEDGPSCNLLFTLFEKDAKLHFSFIKLNHKEGMTHFIEQNESSIKNKLMIHKAILPAISAKPDEAFSLNLEELTFELIEKRYEFSGEKHFYLSEYLIETQEEVQLSVEQSAREISKLAKSIGKKYEDEPFKIMADVKEALYESFEEFGTINNDFIADKVFDDNYSAKKEYKEEIAQILPEKPLELTDVREISEKKFGKQKLKMDNGIELIVPLEIYQDSNSVEFINNPDGTISIVIKNIESITNKL
jgi:hypothetical protein